MLLRRDIVASRKVTALFGEKAGGRSHSFVILRAVTLAAGNALRRDHREQTRPCIAGRPVGKRIFAAVLGSRRSSAPPPVRVASRPPHATLARRRPEAANVQHSHAYAYGVDAWLHARLGRGYGIALSAGLIADIVHRVADAPAHVRERHHALGMALAIAMELALLVHQIGELHERMRRSGDAGAKR
ncbi:MAG: hypothetical protein JOY99_11985 [Sphingomonadaceae bacterium]|nr:hypothetical protein [Sphingomonadaceae bacterium]